MRIVKKKIIMKVSKKSEYGLRAMVHLAKNRAYRQAGKNRKSISIREISNIEGMPFEFLSKIFADLERAKLVKARHGANGGYSLAKPANKITPADVMAVLEKNKKMVNCSLCKRKSKCSAKDVWVKLDNALKNTLKSITLADLIK